MRWGKSWAGEGHPTAFWGASIAAPPAPALGRDLHWIQLLDPLWCPCSPSAGSRAGAVQSQAPLAGRN